MEKYEYENLLTLTKSLVTLYLNATVESSNKDVRKCFEDGLSEVLVLQDEIYQTMMEDGFYTVENVKDTEIKKVWDKLCKDA